MFSHCFYFCFLTISMYIFLDVMENVDSAKEKLVFHLYSMSGEQKKKNKKINKLLVCYLNYHNIIFKMSSGISTLHLSLNPSSIFYVLTLRRMYLQI